jgi:hypothetical protein
MNRGELSIEVLPGADAAIARPQMNQKNPNIYTNPERRHVISKTTSATYREKSICINPNTRNDLLRRAMDR